MNLYAKLQEPKRKAAAAVGMIGAGKFGGHVHRAGAEKPGVHLVVSRIFLPRMHGQPGARGLEAEHYAAASLDVALKSGDARLGGLACARFASRVGDHRRSYRQSDRGGRARASPLSNGKHVVMVTVSGCLLRAVAARKKPRRRASCTASPTVISRRSSAISSTGARGGIPRGRGRARHNGYRILRSPTPETVWGY